MVIMRGGAGSGLDGRGVAMMRRKGSGVGRVAMIGGARSGVGLVAMMWGVRSGLDARGVVMMGGAGVGLGETVEGWVADTMAGCVWCATTAGWVFEGGSRLI